MSVNHKYVDSHVDPGTVYSYMRRYHICHAHSRGGQDENADWMDKLFYSIL